MNSFRFGEANPLLDLPIDEPRDVTVGRGVYRGPGIRSDRVPASLSRVRVNVNDPAGGDNRVVALHGGLVGVAQDSDGALRPVAGWHLTPATVEIDDVIDRIVRDHDTTPPRPGLLLSGSADVVALYRRIGTAALFDHRRAHREPLAADRLRRSWRWSKPRDGAPGDRDCRSSRSSTRYSTRSTRP